MAKSRTSNLEINKEPLLTDGSFIQDEIVKFDANGDAVPAGVTINNITSKESNITDISTPTHNISTTEYILNVLVDSILTLPTTASVGIGQRYKIYTENKIVDIAPQGIDTINGSVSSLRITGYSMVTLICIALNKWRIGD